MKRVVLIVMVVIAAAYAAQAQYPEVTIRQIQEVPADSLTAADAIPTFAANSTQTRGTLQTSPYNGDTVRVTAQVVVPPGIITFTTGIWTMLLYDTVSNASEWGGILLRGLLEDSTQLKTDGFLNVEAGDIITLTGVISEFPLSRGTSATQIQPLAGNPINIIGAAPLPQPIVKNIADFYTGVVPTGTVKFGTGEPFEAMYVEFHDVVLNNKVNLGRGTFSFVDASGNELSEYDWSRYFTLGHGSSFPWPADTTWQRIYAAIGNGTRIDTIRGFITTSSGSEGPRGYRIAPIYPSDIVFSEVPTPPLVSTHRRNPVVVTPDSTATVSVRVTQQSGGSLPKTVSLLYSVNYGAFQSVEMTYQASDTTYVGVIPQQQTDRLVRYFVSVADSFGQTVRLANSSTNGGIASDTSKGFFFYTSLLRPLTIQDVQYTPYVNGRSPYLGAVLTLGGIVTADTTQIALSPASTGWTNAWYMQSTSQPWSGIWLTTADTITQNLMSALRNGDSILVTGTVQEQFDVTRLGNITAVTKVSGGNPTPEPANRLTGTLGVSNGVASAEAYEGMLVRLTDVLLTDLNPTFSDPTEYTVNDGSGGLVVQRSGKYNYSNVPADSASGKIILPLGTRISSLTGILYYSFNQYKFVPRTDADFAGVVTGVEDEPVEAAPASYALEQNYPNPFNPSTVIRYALPAAGFTTIRVYNLIGQEIGTLFNGMQDAGRHTLRFNATSLPSGVYFYRIESGSFRAVKKMMLLK
ncbi:MAG: T9SS type A sorting domain-containing protein [Bacteroidetes bacterium]|nr:T9SS type A sorting domain-containing protein [Bacteroidota bacterium]